MRGLLLLQDKEGRRNYHVTPHPPRFSSAPSPPRGKAFFCGNDSLLSAKSNSFAAKGIAPGTRDGSVSKNGPLVLSRAGKKRSPLLRRKTLLFLIMIRAFFGAFFQRKHRGMEKNPTFVIIMQLVYKSFLRPVEITRVKVEQLNFEKHCIEMKGSQKKNGKAHNGRMDEQLEALLRDHI